MSEAITESTQAVPMREAMCQLRALVNEPPVDADVAPSHYAWSEIDKDNSTLKHFTELSSDQQRRSMSLLGYDAEGNEIIDETASPYSDYLRGKLRDAASFQEAINIWHYHNTDPINALDLLADIARSYASEIINDQEAKRTIIKLTEESAKGAEKAVLGESDQATPEAGLRGLVVAADIVAEDPQAEADIIKRLDNAVKASHDAKGVLANGHAAADPIFAEAISDAISDRLHIPGITLGELVDQHVELKKMDIAEQELLDEIADREAALQELRRKREVASDHLHQEVQPTSKRRTGIRGLLSGLIKVGR